ncbi:chemokine-like factor isoform X2 [Tachyglossus aculeatus]|uniref:chemokine-like factor isoform X2 n=1 Tax=Tachyglossus aculeatus TaxID=9261 RepID=UPI0018F585D1|nr:chemokine-like factor isoform X2 [Tachyglossus aculeatus]
MKSRSNPPSPRPGTSATRRWNWKSFFRGGSKTASSATPATDQQPAGRLGPAWARMRDSSKEFCTSVKGLLKFLSLVLLVLALAFFITSKAHESYIAVTVLELCINLFFIVVYMLGLDKLITSLFWPLLVFCLLATVVSIADAVLIFMKLKLNPSGSAAK